MRVEFFFPLRALIFETQLIQKTQQYLEATNLFKKNPKFYDMEVLVN